MSGNTTDLTESMTDSLGSTPEMLESSWAKLVSTDLSESRMAMLESMPGSMGRRLPLESTVETSVSTTVTLGCSSAMSGCSLDLSESISGWLVSSSGSWANS